MASVPKVEYDRVVAQLDAAYALVARMVALLEGKMAESGAEPAFPVEHVPEEPLAPEIANVLGLYEEFSPTWRRVRGRAVELLADGVPAAEVAEQVRNGERVEL